MTLDPATDAEREQHAQAAIAVLRSSKQFVLFSTETEMGPHKEDEEAKFEFLICAEGLFIDHCVDSIIKYQIISSVAPEMMGGIVIPEEEETDE